MSIDTTLKVTATSAGEALEWDSRKYNVKHPKAGQQHPPSSKREDRQTCGQKREKALWSCYKMPNSKKRKPPRASKSDRGRAIHIPQVHPQGIFFFQIRKLTCVVQDTI